MADSLSLTAKLFFDGSQAVSGMGKVRAAFGGMTEQVQKTKDGLKQAGEGFKGIGFAAAGVKLGVGAAIKRMASFESAMGAVKAKLGEEARPAFQMLEKEAMRLGAVTQFTAAEAAKGMEELAAGGMEPAEIMKAIGPVLNTAAAEGMNLGDAAQIVSQNMNAFGKEAGGAAHVADVLAAVSGATSSSILSLQEGLKYAAGTARQAKVPFEQTVAILGALSDVGLEGSLAGTAFQNAIVRMSQKAKDGKVAVGKMNVPLKYTKEGTMDAKQTFLDMVAALATIKNPMNKVQAAMETFGIRGKGVALAFEAISKEKVDKLFVKLGSTVDGASARMAKLRMEGVHGDFITLSSAIDGAAIALGKMFRPQVRAIAQGMTGFFSDAYKAMELFGQGVSTTDNRFWGLNKTAVEVVRGFREGWAGAKDVVSGFVSVISFVGKAISAVLNPAQALFGPKGGSMGVGNAIAMAMKWGTVAFSLKLVGGALGRVMNIATGSFRALQGVLGGMRTGVGGIVNLLATKFPALGKLAGPLGKLGKGVAAMEKVTAQPVRVVNWDEAGAGIGAGVAPGQLPLPGMGPTPAGRGPAAGPAGWRGRASAAVGTGLAGGGLAVAGGLAANFWITGEGQEASKTLANSALALGAAFGPAGMAVGGIAAGALTLGSKLDELTGASVAVSNYFWDLGKKGRDAAAAVASKAYAASVDIQTIQDQAKALVGFAGRGVAVQTGPGGERKKVTAAMMRESLMRTATAKGSGLTPEQARAVVEGVMKQMGPELAGALARVQLQVKIGEREVAKGVAKAGNESSGRRGEKAAPGTRRRAAAG
jgi:TP901 family phage tail tape measure protein